MENFVYVDSEQLDELCVNFCNLQVKNARWPQLSTRDLIKHVKFDCVFADCDSIFKTEWFEIPDTWQDVDLAETVDYTLTIKKSLNAHISPEDPNEFDIAISTQPKLFQKLKVRVKIILNISHDVVVIQSTPYGWVQYRT